MNLKRNFTSEAQLKETLDFIYDQSKKGKTFHGIIEIAFHEVTIVTAVHNIKSNKGANTPGVDSCKMNDFLQMGKAELIGLIQREMTNYRPRPVRRKYIRKTNGKMRPLGIPTIFDRITQECIRIVLEPMAEAGFYPQSYGFRPYRAAKHALKDIVSLINKPAKAKPIYMIEGDITSFFDNIDHRIMLKKLWKIGVRDKRVLSIIKAMLTAGYMENDIYYDTLTGTVQGGIISTLLANIYLNDFDWMVGRMYHHPIPVLKDSGSDRKRLRRNGVAPKYLIRYADDWTLMTTTKAEAERMLTYLKKYFVHKLRLTLSEEKTVITDLTRDHAHFLGCRIKADYPRGSPERPSSTNLVGKHYPNMKKLQDKVKEIGKEIKKLRYMENHRKILQIERVNAKIIGLSEYYKTTICSQAFRFIDHKVYQSAHPIFNNMADGGRLVQLTKLSNRPERHQGHLTKTFAICEDGSHMGITKAFLTHSQWLKYPYNQHMTPYTVEGRDLYCMQSIRKRSRPMNRPSLNDNPVMDASKDVCDNFEYYMNREYACNRDKGQCKICGQDLTEDNRHCHRIMRKKTLDRANKVQNLAWVCHQCNLYIHGQMIPKSFDKKKTSKILKFRNKLTT